VSDAHGSPRRVDRDTLRPALSVSFDCRLLQPATTPRQHPPTDPGHAWNARPRAIPARQGIHISQHFRVRKDRVDRDGKLTLRHNSRLHHIGVGNNWAGVRVLMLVHELSIRIITEDTGDSSANSNSTPPATTNPAAATATHAGATEHQGVNYERETGVNDVARHHNGGAEGTRTPDPHTASSTKDRPCQSAEERQGRNNGLQAT